MVCIPLDLPGLPYSFFLPFELPNIDNGPYSYPSEDPVTLFLRRSSAALAWISVLNVSYVSNPESVGGVQITGLRSCSVGSTQFAYDIYCSRSLFDTHIRVRLLALLLPCYYADRMMWEPTSV